MPQEPTVTKGGFMVMIDSGMHGLCTVNYSPSEEEAVQFAKAYNKEHGGDAFVVAIQTAIRAPRN